MSRIQGPGQIPSIQIDEEGNQVQQSQEMTDDSQQQSAIQEQIQQEQLIAQQVQTQIDANQELTELKVLATENPQNMMRFDPQKSPSYNLENLNLSQEEIFIPASLKIYDQRVHQAAEAAFKDAMGIKDAQPLPLHMYIAEWRQEIIDETLAQNIDLIRDPADSIVTLAHSIQAQAIQNEENSKVETITQSNTTNAVRPGIGGDIAFDPRQRFGIATTTAAKTTPVAPKASSPVANVGGTFRVQDLINTGSQRVGSVQAPASAKETPTDTTRAVEASTKTVTIPTDDIIKSDATMSSNAAGGLAHYLSELMTEVLKSGFQIDFNAYTLNVMRNTYKIGLDEMNHRRHKVEFYNELKEAIRNELNRARQYFKDQSAYDAAVTFNESISCDAPEMTAAEIQTLLDNGGTYSFTYAGNTYTVYKDGNKYKCKHSDGTVVDDTVQFGDKSVSGYMEISGITGNYFDSNGKVAGTLDSNERLYIGCDGSGNFGMYVGGSEDTTTDNFISVRDGPPRELPPDPGSYTGKEFSDGDDGTYGVDSSTGSTYDNRETGSMEGYIEKLEEQLNRVGTDAGIANTNLQNVLQKNEQIIQAISNCSKMMADTNLNTIRKIG